MKKKPSTTVELRAKATYRAMEKILQQEITDEAELWSVARIMSGDEFLQAAEERSLAKPRLCGHPLCRSHVNEETEPRGKYVIDSSENKVYAVAEGARFCGATCAAATTEFAQRLGTGSEALQRFDRLLDLARQRRETLQSSGSRQTFEEAYTPCKSSEQPSPAADTPHPKASPTATSAPVEKPKSALKNRPKFAAGNSKVPIMASVVKERDPSSAPIAPAPPKRSRKTQAIEGYVPRAAFRSTTQKEDSGTFEQGSEGGRGSGRKVRFNDAVEASDGSTQVLAANLKTNGMVGANATGTVCNDKVSPGGYGWEREAGSSAPKQRSQVIPSTSNAEACAGSEARASAEADDGDGDAPLGRGVREGNGHAAVQGGKPVFVFEVEDPQSPIDSVDASLGATFGRLRVADSVEASSEPSTMRSAAPAVVEEAALAHEEGILPMDEAFARRAGQRGGKIFPQLAAMLPPELLDDGSASEAASDLSEVSDADSNGTASEDWMRSSSDDEEMLGEGDGGKRRRPHYSFFGQLYTHFNAWATESSMQLLHSGPDAPSPGIRTGTVPEIQTALGRFLSIAVPATLDRIGGPAPRNEAERGVVELIMSFNLTSALPAFNQAQWRVVALVMLKALSLERLPMLQASLESREGIHRVNEVLAEASFTVEEFAAILDVLMGEGEDN